MSSSLGKTPPARPRIAPDAVAPLGVPRRAEDLARHIDHTLLKADATDADLERVAGEAREHRFATVCVNSGNVATMARLLAGSATRPIAVVGFPLGASSTKSKVFEAQTAVGDGAAEIDMVVNLGALKSGDRSRVLADIKAVVEAVEVPVKVILETATLSDPQKVLGAQLAMEAGAAYVKTSTGFAKEGGATEADVALLRKTVGPAVGVKASGGVRSAADAWKMFAAGADRIGASSSVEIVTGSQAAKGTY